MKTSSGQDQQTRLWDGNSSRLPQGCASYQYCAGRSVYWMCGFPSLTSLQLPVSQLIRKSPLLWKSYRGNPGMDLLAFPCGWRQRRAMESRIIGFAASTQHWFHPCQTSMFHPCSVVGKPRQPESQTLLEHTSDVCMEHTATAIIFISYQLFFLKGGGILNSLLIPYFFCKEILLYVGIFCSNNALGQTPRNNICNIYSDKVLA